MKKLLLFTATLLLSITVAFAQAPNKLNYQGVARTNSGDPIANQNISLRISILDGAAEEYVETHIVNTNDFGLYNVKIGDGVPTVGTMNAIDWSATNKNIKVEIDPAGGTTYTDLGTTELASVPYALYANNLDQMGANADQVLKWDGNEWTPSDAAEGFFKVDNNSIVYNDPSNFGNDFLVNTEDVNHITSGFEDKSMFIFSKEGAFRAGRVNNENWDIDSIGDASFAVGVNTKATGRRAVATGYGTEASGQYSVAMGYQTEASADKAVAMGDKTLASGTSAFAMGYQTKALNSYSTALGRLTEASGLQSIALGYGTEASGHSSFAMGIETIASGNRSIAMGGYTKATGNFSTAMGLQTKAEGDASIAMGNNSTTSADNSAVFGRFISLSASATGSIYLADASRTVEADRDTRTMNNRFYSRFDNGYYFYTSGASNIGASLVGGANSWSTISDSTKKENFLEADGKSFLEKIGQMKLGSWNYKGQDKETFRHYGPMAQEFYAYFGNDGIGTIGNDTTIASADIDGVMMIAIQALIKENEELKQKVSEVDNLKAELSQNQSELEELRSIVNTLVQQGEEKKMANASILKEGIILD